MSHIEWSPTLIDQITEDFVRRLRQGERPDPDEYVARYPQATAALGELLPTLIAIEHLKPNAAKVIATEPGRQETSIEALKTLGDFVIIRQVGRGGMGVVDEAIQESLGRRVALKVLPKHLVDDRNREARFEREAKAAAALHPTNIVPGFSVGHRLWVGQRRRPTGSDQHGRCLRNAPLHGAGSIQQRKRTTK